MDETSENSSETSRSLRLIDDLSGVTSNWLLFSILERSETFFGLYYFKMSFVDLGLRLGKDFSVFMVS